MAEAVAGTPPFPLEEPGLWVELRAPQPSRFAGRPALFVDRDGTLNPDTGYPDDPDDIVLVEPMVPVLRAANEAGLAVVMVTNQSGVGRGYFGWEGFAATNRRLLELLSAHGCRVDLVLACAYHPQALPPYRADRHPMRKPAPGMLLRAATLLSLDLPHSAVVGDRDRDLEAGRLAGLHEGWLVGEGALPEPKPGFSARRLAVPADFAVLEGRLARWGGGSS